MRAEGIFLRDNKGNDWRNIPRLFGDLVDIIYIPACGCLVESTGMIVEEESGIRRDDTINFKLALLMFFHPAGEMQSKPIPRRVSRHNDMFPVQELLERVGTMRQLPLLSSYLKTRRREVQLWRHGEIATHSRRREFPVGRLTNPDNGTRLVHSRYVCT